MWNWFHLGCIEEDFEDTCESNSCSDEVIWIKECRECQNIVKSRTLYGCNEKNKVRFKKMPESVLNSTLKRIFNNGIGIQVG